MAGADLPAESPRPGTQILLDDDVCRRAEIPRKLDGVAAAELEVTALIDASTDRIDVRELSSGNSHRAPIMPCALRGRYRARMIGLGLA